MPLRLIAVLAPALLLAQALAQTLGSHPPRILTRSEAEYSEEARRAGVNTTILVSFAVNENGEPQDIKIVQGAGFGLDEQAIRAIESWRFEPGVKEGKPFAAPTHAELHFSLQDKANHGQTARLNFSLAPGVQRPELIKGKIPPNPDPPGDASMRVRFAVGPNGRPTALQVFETTNREWADRALREMAGWRFRPAMREGQPEEVNGIFELSVGRQAPANRPTLSRQ